MTIKPITETITFNFESEAQHAAFRAKLKLPDADKRLRRFEEFVMEIHAAAVQKGDEMVINRDDWAAAFERLWG